MADAAVVGRGSNAYLMPAAEFPTEVTYLTGVKVLEPIRYSVLGGPVARRWWQRSREEWFIVNEFCSLGPFATEAEARKVLRYSL